MKLELILILILAVMMLGGWIWGFSQYKKKEGLEKNLIELDAYSLDVVGQRKKALLMDKDSLIRALEKNEAIQHKFKQQLLDRKSDSITYEEAKEIFESLTK